MIAASLAAFDLRDAATPVVPVAADSLVDQIDVLAGTDRHVVFATAEVTVHLDVTHLPEHRRVQVGVDPDDGSEILLLQPGSGATHRVGRPERRLDGVAPGLSAVVLQRADGTAVRTAWLVI